MGAQLLGALWRLHLLVPGLLHGRVPELALLALGCGGQVRVA